MSHTQIHAPKETLDSQRRMSRKSRRLLSAIASVLALSPAMALAGGSPQLFWNPGNNANGFEGGPGTWNTSSNVFADFNFPYTNTNWTNWSAGTGNYGALFYGTGANVTVSGTVLVNRLEFGVDGYVLQGDPLYLFKDLANGTQDYMDLSIYSGTTTINSNLVNAPGGVGTQNLEKNGSGTLVLGGNNSGFVGTLKVNSGVLQFSELNNVSGFSSIELSNASSLRYTGGTTTDLSAKSFTISGGGAVTLDVASGQLTLGAVREVPVDFNLGLTKIGAGALSVGLLDYTGNTVVLAGTLILNADSSTGTQSTRPYGQNTSGGVMATVAVNAGATLRLANGATGSAVGFAPVTIAAADTLNSLPAAILEGNGTITSNVTLNGVARATGTDTLTLSGNVTANSATIQRDGGASLVFGNTTFNGNTTLSFPLTTTSATGLTTGTLTIASPTTIDLAGTGAVSAGTYKLIDYSGSLTPNQFARLKVLNMPGGFVSGVVNNTAGTSVDAVLELAGASNTWVGTTGDWSTVAANWTSNPYADGQQVTFNDSGTTKTVTGADVSPQKITVNNSVGNDYSIANNITGYVLGGIEKTGAGTLTLTGNNTIAGPINVSGGKLVASASSAQTSLGSGAISLNGTTLQINATGSNTQGLGGRYYNSGNQNWTAGYDFANNAPALAQPVTEGNVNYNNTLDDRDTARVLPPGIGVDDGVQITNFSIEWVGKINIPTTGYYKFYTSSDDGTRVNIDGRLVAVSDGGHGMVEGGGVDVYLTAGLHDFRSWMTQGGGGAGHIISWSSTDAGITKQAIPATAFRLPETNLAAAGGASNLLTLGNGLNVSGSATLDLASVDANTLGVSFANMSMASGSTLTVSGAARKMVEGASLKLGYNPTTDTFSGGTMTIAGDPDVRIAGALDDGGQSVTLVRTGAGALMLATAGASSTLGSGSTIQMNGNELIATGEWTTSWANPLGSAQIVLNNNSTLVLDARRIVNPGALNAATLTTEQPDFANNIEITGNATIQSNIQGKQTIVGNTSDTITIPTGAVLTLDAVSGVSGGSTAGAPMLLRTSLAGDGALTVRSTAYGQTGNRATVTLGGTLSYTGPTTVESGTLRMGSMFSGTTLAVNAGGTFDMAGLPTTFQSVNIAGTLAMNGATLTLGADNSNSSITGSVTGNGTINKDGTGILTMTSATSMATNLTVNNGSATVNASLGGSVTVNNSSLVVNGSVTGSATVNGGLLRVTGGASSAQVNSGTLEMTGTLSSGVIGDGFNPATLSPHTSTTSTGTLNLNSSSLELKTGATLALNLSSSRFNFDRITNVSTLTLNSNAVTVASTGGSLALGSYDVISLNSGAIISGSLVGPANTATRKFSLLAPTDVGGQADKFLLVVDTFTYRWDGNINGNWDLATANWKNESDVSALYVDDTRALFNDSASGTTSVTLSADRSPIETRFENSLKNYTLGGAGGIAGAGTLTKTGTGSLTLNNANLYTGATAIQGGTVALGNAAALPAASAVSLASGATLQLNTPSTIGSLTGEGTVNLNGNGLSLGADNRTATFAGKLTGAGGITKVGTGMEIVRGEVNDFTGTVAINAGTLRISRESELSALTNPVVLNGGALGVSSTLISRPLSVASGATGTIDVARNSLVTNVFTNLAVPATSTLSKAGQGTLSLRTDNTSFLGTFRIADGGGTTRLVGSARLGSVAAINIGVNAQFEVNNATYGAYVADRVSDTAPITILNTGVLFQRMNDASGTRNENYGAVTAKDGVAIIESNPQSNGVGVLSVASIARSGVSAYVFRGWELDDPAGTNNRGRIEIRTTAPTMTNGIIGGGNSGAWAAAYDTNANSAHDFAFYDGATKLVYPLPNGTRPTTLAAAGATDNVRIIAADTLTASKTVNTLKSEAGAGLTLDPGVVLTLGSGGLMGTGGTAARVITGGTITAGDGGAGVAELHVWSRSQETTLQSVIADNGLQPLRLVIDGWEGNSNVRLSGPTNNTYSGGTYLNGNSIITGNTANRSYLGSGPVVIRQAAVTMDAVGPSSFPGTVANPTYTATQNSVIVLPDNTNAVAANEVFSIDAGSVIVLRAKTPNLVASGVGQNLVLAPGAVIASQDAGNLDLIAGLGTTPLYFRGYQANLQESYTVGLGTPWVGISNDRNTRSWQGGTITVAPGTEEVFIQGLANTMSGVPARLAIGDGTGTAVPSFNVSNPVNFVVQGYVQLDEVAPSYSNLITFVVRPGGELYLTQNDALGGGGTDNPATRVNVVLQAGATLNMPNTAGFAGVNGPITLEPGSRFIADDNTVNVIMKGSADAALNFAPGAILHITGSNAITGDLPLNTSVGTIVRQQADNVVGISTRLGGPGVIYELVDNNRTFTSQATVENLLISGGGGLTNDGFNRQVNQGWGAIVVGAGGAFVAPSTGTTLTVQENFNIGDNTLTLGYVGSIDGIDKFGTTITVSGGGGGSTSGPDGIYRLTNNTRVNIDADHALPDLATIDIEAGSTLVLQQNDFVESVGGLSGAGNVSTTEGGAPVLQVGWNNKPTTFSGAFTNAAPGTNHPHLRKVGTGTLTLTGISNSVDEMWAMQGELKLAQGGKTAFAGNFITKGGTLTLDNSVTAVNDRLGGATKALTSRGGTFRIVGNSSTAVTENLGAFTIDLGHSILNLDATGTAGITLSVASVSGTDANRGTMLIRSPNLGATAGAGVANFKATTPNLRGAGGTAGSPTISIRPDILVDTSMTGLGTTYATYDTVNGYRGLTAAEYLPYFIDGNGTTARPNVSTSLPTTINGSASAGGVILKSGASISGKGDLHITGILVEENVTTSISGANLRSGDSGNNGPVVIYTMPGSTLDLNVPIGANAGAGINKNYSGTLNLNRRNFYVNQGLNVNDGLVNLNGGVNTLAFDWRSNSTYNLRLAGGTVDLKGNSQILNELHGASFVNAAGSAAGTITNSAIGTPVELLANGNAPNASDGFSGTISGNLNFTKHGGGTVNYTNPHTYTGTTRIIGGVARYRELGVMPGSTLDLNYAQVYFDSRSSFTEPLPHGTQRFATNLVVTSRGGHFRSDEMPGEAEVNVLDTFNMIEGMNTFENRAGQSGSQTLTADKLIRGTSIPGTMLRFYMDNGGRLTPAGSTGQQDSRIYFNTLNGAPIADGFMPGWVVLNSGNFAYYRAVNGVSEPNQNGAPNYATTLASGNVTNLAGATINLPAGDQVTNLLRIAQGGDLTLNFNTNTQLLTLEGGALLRSDNNNATTVGSATVRGRITSGTSELFLHFHQGTATFNTVIEDNTGPVNLIKGMSGTLNLTANNTYTGATVVNGGTLGTAAATAGIVIPSDQIYVHGGATLTVAGAGQLKLGGPTLNIRGNGTVNINASNPLAAIDFFNSGGGGNPTVALGTGVIAPLAGNVTVSQQQLIQTPQISGAGILDLGTATAGDTKTTTFNVSAPANIASLVDAGAYQYPLGLNVSAIVQNAKIVKTGNAMMSLTNAANANIWSIDIEGGAIRYDNATAIGNATTVINIASGAALIGATGSAQTVAGTINLNGGRILTSNQNVTFSGSVNINADTNFYLSDVWHGVGSRTTSITGVLASDAARTITLEAIDARPVWSQILQLRNTGNTFTGNYVVNAGAILESNSSTGNGNTLGASPISLVGGGLNLRENGAASNSIVTTFSANNVSVSGNATLDVNRSSGSNSGNRLLLGSLTMANGSSLTVTGGNTYSAGVSPVTLDGTTFAINTNSANLYLGTVTATGATPAVVTKGGNNTLLLESTSNVNIGSYIVTAGALESRPAALTGSTLGSSAVELNAGNALVSSNATLNLRDNGAGSNGVLDYSSTNVTARGRQATISVDRISTNSGNTFQVGTLAIDPGTTFTVNSGNSYRLAATSTNVGASGSVRLNVTGGGFDIGAITGNADLHKYGGSTAVINVAAPTRTSATVVGEGTLSVTASGNALGTGAITTFATATGAPVLQFNPGAANVVDLSTGTGAVTNNATLRVTSGTTNLGNRSIGSTNLTTAVGSIQFGTVSGLAAGELSAKFFRAGAVAGLSDFDGVKPIVRNSLYFENSTGTLLNPGVPTPPANSYVTSKILATETIDYALTVNRGTNESLSFKAALGGTGGFTGDMQQFGMLVQGKLVVGGAGNAFQPGEVISFGLGSDDGTILYIDYNGTPGFQADERVVDNNINQGFVGRSGAVLIPTAGTYDFAIGYYNGTGTAQDPTITMRAQPGGTLGQPLAYATMPIVGHNQTITTSAASRVEVQANAALESGDITAGTLDIAAGASAKINAGATQASYVKALSINATGKLDMTNNDLVVSGATLASVVAQVQTGRAGGAWNGNGINSSSAATNPLMSTGLGVIANNDGSGNPLFLDGGVGNPPAFSGRTVALDDVLVKYTYNGDSNLDGVIDADDYFQIDAGFIAAGAKTGWYNGDYNYDGKIDIDDYFLIDTAYARQGAPLSGGDLAPIAPVAPSAAVPEPGTLSLLALGAAALLGRRRRK